VLLRVKVVEQALGVERAARPGDGDEYFQQPENIRSPRPGLARDSAAGELFARNLNVLT
jgi:hypothetical protein